MPNMLLRHSALMIAVAILSVLAWFNPPPAHGLNAAQATPTVAPTATNGVQRIVFVADKNGAFNIYAMDVDGKNIVRLTNSRDLSCSRPFRPMAS